ncbi:MAG TPA: sensor histidine kinase [Nitrososphaera sp.]|nr:sensor histidine kinase [Nitrososphaera sp.]
MFPRVFALKHQGKPYSRPKAIGTLSVIVLVLFSFVIFFYIQQQAQGEIKNALFDRHRDEQIEVTRKMSEHIGSDLNLVMNTLEGLANSRYLQSGDFYSENARKLIEQKYNDLNPRINRLLVLNENNIVAISYAPPNLDTYLSSDLSLRDWVIETKDANKPVFSSGFERQESYRIFVSYPIVDRDTGQFRGILAISIPTVQYFAYFANVLDVNSQFLAAYDRNGILLAVGASQDLVGENFFGEKTQAFIDHNPILNNMTSSLLEGKSGYGIYNYGTGERITTQYPILVQGQPMYFIQLVTPTEEIYADIDDSLEGESTKYFLLLLGTLFSIAILAAFLIKWNAVLDRSVQSRTKELAAANARLAQNLENQREFLSIAAHELRNPVQPILGLAEVLQARAGEYTVDGVGGVISKGTEDRDRQLIDAILRNAKRLYRLTEDLLDASKIESGSLRLNKETFDLSKVVASTLQDFASSIDKNKKISVIGIPAESMIVNADRERIVQVLFNLLNNSQKFVAHGTIHVGLKKQGDHAVATIRDDGPGIHPDVLPRLFAKFVTRSERGTGLGLFISKGIVEAHSGEIWAENNVEGRGASFYFKLPLVPGSESPTGSDPE